VVCLSVCLSVTIVSPAKTVEPVGVWGMDLGGKRKLVLDGGTRWRNVANTSEPSMCAMMRPFYPIPSL